MTPTRPRMPASVTVLRNKYVSSADRHRSEVLVLLLASALVRPYRTDAHFAQYDAGRRLRRDSLGEVAIKMWVRAFDFDCPEVHGSREPAPEKWRREQRARVREFAAVHGWPFYYETKGGARIVNLLPEP